jgi:hypothetical protein
MPSINSNPFADPEMLSISDIEDKLKTVASSCEGAIQLIKTKRGRVSFSLATQTRHDNEVRSTIIKSLKEVKRMSEAAVSQYDECWYKVQNSLSEARAAVASIPATDDSIAKSHQFLMDKARETEHLSFARTWAANYNPKSESAPSTLLQDADKWYAQLPPKDVSNDVHLIGRRQYIICADDLPRKHHTRSLVCSSFQS